MDVRIGLRTGDITIDTEADALAVGWVWRGGDEGEPELAFASRRTPRSGSMSISPASRGIDLRW